MEVKLYQINMDRDEDGVCFMRSESLSRLQGTDQINSTIYDLVFAGDLPCDNLEDVYRIFNLDHPEGYTGRSLSVSDVVQIQNPTDGNPSFHYCDSFGFKEVAFDPELTQDAQAPQTIKVVLVQPGKLARPAEIDASLAGMQKAVQGSIQAYYPFDEQVCIVCNEEGKLTGMPLNRAVYMDTVLEHDVSYSEMTKQFREQERSGKGRHTTGYIVFTEDSFDQPYSVESRTYEVSSNNKAFQPNMGGYSIYSSSIDGSDPMIRLERYMADEHGGHNGWKIERCYFKNTAREMVEIIAGPFFICDCSGENFASLSDEQIKKYTEMFKRPERFMKCNDTFIAIPYTPSKNNER